MTLVTLTPNSTIVNNGTIGGGAPTAHSPAGRGVTDYGRGVTDYGRGVTDYGRGVTDYAAGGSTGG